MPVTAYAGWLNVPGGSPGPVPPPGLEAPPVYLTSRAEMESIASARGVNLRIDDNEDGVISQVGSGLVVEEQFLTDMIEESSDEALMRLEHYYEDTVLETSRWVRRRVSYIALHQLSARRGNPKNFCDEFKRYMRQFDRIMEGDPQMQIPRLPKRANFEPAMSNQLVSHWWIQRKLRTVQATSRGGTDGRQDLDRGYWWYY